MQATFSLKIVFVLTVDITNPTTPKPITNIKQSANDSKPTILAISLTILEIY